MRITRQADYAVRAVLYLAQLGTERRVSTAQIAETQHIPMSFLSKIVSQLAASGLLRSQRGVRGGVSLARSPEQISLLNVVEAIDGAIVMNECTEDPSICALGHTCSVRPVWCDLRRDVSQRMAQITFNQLTHNLQPVEVTPNGHEVAPIRFISEN